MAKIKIQSASSVAGKETIYVDVDDEITAIIDKVGAAKGKVVALVLPKRSTVLQSIVNMKLLKRTADTAGKNLVLVTTEAGLMPLAGAVGLYVASTPTSKPSIPTAPAGPSDETEDVDEPLDITDGNTDGSDEEFDNKASASKTVGELAAAGAVGKMAVDDVDESIDMSDDADAASDTGTTPAKTSKPKKDKKLTVPNFDSFKKKIALGVVVFIALIAGWIFATSVLPKAVITVKTDSDTIPTNLNLTLNTEAKTLDVANNVVPATALSQQKTSSEQVPATGQQNNGQKATGSVTMTAQKCGGNAFEPPSTVGVGTTMTASGHTYVLQEAVSFTTSGASPAGPGCYKYPASGGKADITALKGGAEYNASSLDFTVTGRSDVSANGSAEGGTDQITKVVTQSDIDGATAKMKAGDANTVKDKLKADLQAKGLQAVPTTFLAGTPAVTTSAKAGDATDNVTVTAVTTYTMLGIQQSDLKKLVENNVNGQLKKGKQVILDDGVANAEFTQQNPASATSASVSVEVKSQVGPHLDVDALKKQLAGKKSGDVKSIIKQTPGVTDVEVKFSPFWVNKVPGNSEKVTINIVKAD